MLHSVYFRLCIFKWNKFHKLLFKRLERGTVLIELHANYSDYCICNVFESTRVRLVYYFKRVCISPAFIHLNGNIFSEYIGWMDFLISVCITGVLLCRIVLSKIRNYLSLNQCKRNSQTACNILLPVDSMNKHSKVLKKYCCYFIL